MLSAAAGIDFATLVRAGSTPIGDDPDGADAAGPERSVRRWSEYDPGPSAVAGGEVVLDEARPPLASTDGVDAGASGGPAAGPYPVDDRRIRGLDLTVVRHGQSTANVAFAAAEVAGRAETGLVGRDRDIPLSPLGERQAAAVGRRLVGLPAGRRPEVVICSPYRRARQTWRFAVAAADAAGVRLPEPLVDDRLRDREMGELELLTRAAIGVRFPAEAARWRETDELRYRPPGGESLLDVGARLAPLLADLRTSHAGRRLLLVAHDSVVLMLRHLIERLSLAELRAVVAAGPVANASFTAWSDVDGDDGPVLVEYDVVDHLQADPS
ncbi:histidine phosphatase family protein [Plantactinospora sp. ZYX-F-223]|uniref:histidine phosphatase family protein n=1 Tax=Plantactinospora sp. ZYX-F-223 TaxID=3144103 RepID=UPI0031FCD18E